MIKAFAIENEHLESNIFPTYYLFKEKINSFSERDDITSFNLGDKDVLEVLTDGEHAGQKFVPEGALFIKNSSVKRYGISEYDGFYITHEKNNLLKRSKLKKDDILFTTIGYYLGVAALVNENIEGANINQNVVRIRINPKFTTPQYLAYFLNSKLLRFQIDNLFTGTYPILTYPKIKSLKIFVKNKQVEKKVTDNAIEAEQLQREALKLISEARKIFVASLNVDFSKINRNNFYAVYFDTVDLGKSLIPAFYFPLYGNTQNEIEKNNECVRLGDVAICKEVTKLVQPIINVT
jgi:restriction endonuclease S subunit